eukprot:4275343-Amphidinium_carterae.1
MKMLFHVLSVEAQPHIETEGWEQELAAAGACNASGVVDVKHFVAFCQQGGGEGTKIVLGVLSTPQQEDERLAAPSEPAIEMLAAGSTELSVSFRVQEDESSRLAVPAEPWNEVLAATNTKPGGPCNPSERDARPISSLMSMASTLCGEQTPLPSPEDQAGAVVLVDSKRYVLGERLGTGGGGSVFAATLKREHVDVHEAADVHVAVDEESDSHDPVSMALKLVGGVGNAELRGVDTRLACVAVEAVAAAEVRRMAHNEVMRWQ